MIEIIFEVREDEADGGYVATALGHAIATQGETMDELRDMVRDAVQCHFGDGVPGPMPRLIRLHFVRDEVLATRESRASSPARTWPARWACWATSECGRTARTSG